MLLRSCPDVRGKNATSSPICFFPKKKIISCCYYSVPWCSMTKVFPQYGLALSLIFLAVVEAADSVGAETGSPLVGKGSTPVAVLLAAAPAAGGVAVLVAVAVAVARRACWGEGCEKGSGVAPMGTPGSASSTVLPVGSFVRNFFLQDGARRSLPPSPYKNKEQGQSPWRTWHKLQ